MKNRPADRERNVTNAKTLREIGGQILKMNDTMIVKSIHANVFAAWTGLFLLWTSSPGAWGEEPAEVGNTGAAERESWVPVEAGLVLDAPGARNILDALLSPAILGRIENSDGWKKYRRSPKGIRDGLFLRYLENRFDGSWDETLKKLASKGLTLGVGGGGVWALIMEAENEAFLQEAHELFLSVGRSGAKKKGSTAFVQDYHYRGVTFWTISGGKDYHAVLGDRIVVSNNLETFKRILDLRSGDATGSIANVPEYQAAKESAADGDKGATLVLSPGALEALSRGKKGKELKEPNPLAVLLLAGYGETFRNTGWLGMGFEAGDGALTFRVAAEETAAKVESAAAFARPSEAGEGVLPLLDVPRRLASLSLYRDLGEFYAAKDDLFPERTSGLILFENMMGIYFSGRDLTDEVMMELDPHIRMVVAEQGYDSGEGVPGVQVPAFALVFRMRNPEEFSPVAEEAWQKVIGMVNFTRGQKAQRGLIIDRLIHEDVKFTCAAFSAAGEENRNQLDTRFNFSPAIAYFGEHLILSSEEHLTRDVIDVLKAEDESKQARPVSGMTSVLELDGQALAAVVENNREHFIRQNMLKKGQDRAQAESEFNVLPIILSTLGTGTLELGGDDEEGRSLQLRFDLNRSAGQGVTAATASN